MMEGLSLYQAPTKEGPAELVTQARNLELFVKSSSKF